MSQTNDSALKMADVTDQEIPTAMEALRALKTERKARTKYHINFKLRGKLESIHDPQQERKHWTKSRFKAVRHNFRN